jgi:hypothetical protein
LSQSNPGSTLSVIEPGFSFASLDAPQAFVGDDRAALALGNQSHRFQLFPHPPAKSRLGNSRCVMPQDA